MLQEQYIENLVGLEDVIIKNVQTNEFHAIIELERKKMPHICPACGAETTRIHDYRIQRVRDLSSFGKSVVLHLKKRRYVCPHCQKRFAEKNPFLGRYQQLTKRLQAHIISSFSQMRTATNVAFEHGCSVTTAIRYLDQISHSRPVLPEVLAIDEFKGNAGGEKFQCILTNPRKHKVLDILPNRKLENLCQYFNQFSKEQKNNVRYVVMDMSKEFQSLAKTIFPKATIVIDKFHVIRYVIWALERTRVKIQKQFGAERRKYFKRSRFLLIRKKKDLSKDQLEQLTLMLSLSPELAQAYALKELFYAVMASQTREEAKAKLVHFMMMAQATNLEEFKKVITTISNWSKEFLNAFDTKLSNGFTEGMNNRTKVLKRICYGVRNFERFRNRILYLDSASPPKKSVKKKQHEKKAA